MSDATPQRFEVSRTLALSDGVFAIAATLLVLSIHFPRLADEGRLAHALADQSGELLSWLLSFVVVALMWTRHHAFFADLEHVDRGLTQLNFVYLGGVAFLPYPTQILGSYGSEPAAVALYAVTLALISAAGGAMALHAHRARLLSGRGEQRKAERDAIAPWWLTPAIVLLAIPTSFALGAWALLVWLAVPLVRRGRRPGD